MKNCGFYFILVLLLFFFLPKPASAHWFQTVSGDLYSNGQISMGTWTGTPSNTFLSYNNSARGTSGVITHNNSSNTIGAGTQDNSNPGNATESWIQRRPTGNNKLQVVASGYLEELRIQLGATNSLPFVEGHARVDRDNYCPLSTQLAAPYNYRVTGDVIFECLLAPSFDPPAGQKLTIFVQGNVRVRSPIVLSSTAGSFFMIIATGTITFENSVGGSLAAPGVTGVFVAPTITTSEGGQSPRALFGQGVFYALTTFNLNRQLTAAAGGQGVPAETFIYKPSLLVAAPTALWDSFSNYAEIEP